MSISIIAGRRRQSEAEKLETALIEMGFDDVTLFGSEGEPPDTLELVIKGNGKEWHFVPA